MRLIGQTEDGETIVALSLPETRVFSALHQACTNGTGDEWYTIELRRDAITLGQNYEGAFGAILAWTNAKFAINKMQELIDDIKNVVG